MSHIRKLLAAVLLAIGGAVTAAYSDDVFTNGEKVQVAILGVGAFYVYASANTIGPVWAAAKALASGATAFLTGIAGFYANGQEMTNQAWVLTGIAAVTAMVVYFTPNEPAPAG